MARTHGHGNPKWTRDETILALDLYFSAEGVIPSRDDARVKALSSLLRNLYYHDPHSRRASFRNADGVAFKLQNLRQVATGEGLGNVSAMDRRVWSEFASDREAVRELASRIRLGLTLSESLRSAASDANEDEEFFEGRVLTAIHKTRERDPKIRKRLLEARRKKGRLICDMCLRPTEVKGSSFDAAIFEVHHLVPLSAAIERKTLLSDLALLCANCHRLLHRAISHQKQWLSIDEGRRVLGLQPLQRGRSTAVQLLAEV